MTAKNQNDSLKAQINCFKQLYDPKECQSDSKNDNTISECKHN